MSDTTDGHYLDEFLQERLPALGLDFETYGPYVRGLVIDDDDDNDKTTVHSANTNDDDNDDNDVVDDSNWNDIMELLQASSETHADDSEAFCIVLKQEIKKRQAHYRLEMGREIQEQRQRKHIQEQEQLAHEIALAKQKEEELQQLQHKQQQQQKDGVTSFSEGTDDDTKKWLMKRFEYDESEEMGADGNFVKTTGNNDKASNDNDDEIVSNKDAAAKAHQEKLNQMKSQKSVSKKDEQQKTKQARLDKLKQKEERQKKAQKGERHR